MKVLGRIFSIAIFRCLLYISLHPAGSLIRCTVLSANGDGPSSNDGTRNQCS